MIDWYKERHRLKPGMVFLDRYGDMIELDRRVPGDATKWYVLDWDNGWFAYDSTVEACDLVEYLPHF